VREGATINRGTAARGKTVIGSNNLFMACSHIGHDCVVGDYNVIVNNVLLAGEVEIGDWVVFGGQGGVVQFTRIGSHAMIGAGTFVNKDIPPFVKASHEPITYVGANTIGLRRRGFTDEQVHLIQSIFRIIFQSGYSYGKACDMVMEQFPQSAERDMIVNFIRESKKGILKPWNPRRKEEE
jgi:UDP-N-acetylglucosamine acyltransferase